MPRVTMPDGTSYRITAPEGMSDAEIADVATKHWQSERETQAASAVMAGAGGGGFAVGSGNLGTTLADLGKGALRGGAEGILGLVQAGMDVTGAVAPGLRERTGEISRAIPGEMQKIREKLPLSNESVGSIGELGGEMLPSMAVPGGPIIKGAVGGATALLEEGGGLVDRIVGGILGGTFGKILDVGGKQISKVLNAKGLAGKLDAAKELFSEVNPAAAPLKQRLNSTIERKWSRYGDLTRMAMEEGDKMGRLDVSGVASKTHGLIEEAGKVSGQDAGAVKLMKDTERVLSQPVNSPPDLTVGGSKFTRDPMTGEYKNAAGDALPDRIVQAAMPPDAGPPDVRYKHLKAMVENIDDFLERKGGSSNDAVAKVREMRAAIAARMDEVRSPSTAALERKAQGFYDKELGKYDKAIMKEILGAKDDFGRAQIVLQHIVKNPKVDAGVAKDVSEMLGKPGREAVSAHMMHDAMVDSVDKKGVFDPVKFLKYFDDKPGFDPFKAEHFDEVAKGFSQYIKHEATLQGESRIPGIAPGTRHALSLATTAGRIVAHGAAGNMMGVVKAAGEYLAPYATLSLANRAFQDSFLRHLFIVASRIPEGAPRWQRVMGQISSRFAGPAAGQAGQLGSEVSERMGQ